MLKLAVEWGKVEKAHAQDRNTTGENHRDRVLSSEEEIRYFKAATASAKSIQEAYQRRAGRNPSDDAR